MADAMQDEDAFARLPDSLLPLAICKRDLKPSAINAINSACRQHFFTQTGIVDMPRDMTIVELLRKLLPKLSRLGALHVDNCVINRDQTRIESAIDEHCHHLHPPSPYVN